jgi:HTH-type transcriptional regulator, transcriptional repressor of NAD biosynthesis genes
MPPHRGHLHLIDFASNYADSLTVVVGSLKSEPIPGDLRFTWMQELFPHLDVVHLTDENPQHPNQHPDFWFIWKRSLEQVCSRKIDLLFASEDYGQKLAEVLGAKFIPTNQGRESVPISGSEIRKAPEEHWEYIPRPVRPYYTKTVVFFGPESTGKTTLSRFLATENTATWVPEYARTYLRGREDDFELADMELIARGQQSSMTAALRLGRPLVLSDTDTLSTKLWCQELFGRVPESVERLAMKEHPDLTILLRPDVPWVGGPLRLRAETREEFFQRCLQLLEESGRIYRVVGGSWSEREKQAREHINSLRTPPGISFQSGS